MQPFRHLEAIAAPLPIENVDTDKILAGRFLKTTTRAGLGSKLFWAMRQEPDCLFNHAPWNTSGIIVALGNFGCGSSREHAPWALLDFGIRCIVAPSFADIFYNNCLKNGILPVVLPDRDVARLMRLAGDAATARMVVDLPAQTIETSEATIRFEIAPRCKQDIIEGKDEIASTLARSGRISIFEDGQRTARPWMADIRDDMFL